jgi:hypothetical protein
MSTTFGKSLRKPNLKSDDKKNRPTFFPPIKVFMSVWQRVAMYSLKYHRASHALPFYALRAVHPCNDLMAVSGVARP